MESQKYFQSYHNYFWEWDNQLFSVDEDCQPIAIPNGKTIAYEEYIIEVLEFLAEDSLPPFGSLLLAVIATNPENEDAIEMIRQLAEEKSKLNKSSYVNPEGEFFRVGAAIDFLKLLASLPEEYKTGEKRLQLFQTIFHDCHKRVSSDKAIKMLYEYRSNKNQGISSHNKEPFNLGVFIKDFRTIAILKVKFPTVLSLLKAMENVPEEEIKEQLAEDVFEEQTALDTPEDFIEELIREERTFQVGSLVKRIWSGLNIPLHHNMPSAQPLGGISDLTNKGDFDKLVISEFANDDDVFMSRIANNEALYIQREVPPEADKFQRILLIDTTLINWGNPKIVAFASAIAIATHPKTDIQCKIFVVGDTYQEIYVENVNQVISALSELSGKLNCAAGLDLFFSEHPVNPKKEEVFLISSDESLKLKLMQKAMSDYFNSIKYVFVTNVEGSISIFKNQNKGRKQLQEIKMPLEELWKREVVNKKYVKNLSSDNNIPLLYPVERTYQNIFHDQDNYYLYLNGSLFLFHKERFDKGFTKIASNLPFYMGEFAIKGNTKGELLLLNYSYGSSQNITVINLTTKEAISKPAFAEAQNGKLNFFEHRNNFYFTNNIDFWRVKSNCEIELLQDPVIVKAFDEHFTKQSLFVQNYKNHKLKYTIVKKVESVGIKDNVFRINDYYLVNYSFDKVKKYHMIGNNELSLTPYGNLVLKHKGQNAITITKLIVENTGKTLKEVNTLIGEHLGLILENVPISVAEHLKKILETNGAVCYIETKCFESKDGSRITNKDGILIFESSDKQIPVFYIPFVCNMQTTMATAAEYAGSNYFIAEEYSQESIRNELFTEKYIAPFISNIVPWN